MWNIRQTRVVNIHKVIWSVSGKKKQISLVPILPLDYERKVRTTEHRRLKNEKEKGTIEDDWTNTVGADINKIVGIRFYYVYFI